MPPQELAVASLMVDESEVLDDDGERARCEAAA